MHKRKQYKFTRKLVRNLTNITLNFVHFSVFMIEKSFCERFFSKFVFNCYWDDVMHYRGTKNLNVHLRGGMYIEVKKLASKSIEPPDHETPPKYYTSKKIPTLPKLKNDSLISV